MRLWADKWLYRRDDRWNDLVQEGTVGVMHAIRLYHPGRLCKFSTYTVPWVRKYVRLAGLRFQKAEGRTSSVALNALAHVAGREKPPEVSEMDDYLRRLPARWREVLTRIFGLDGRLTETNKQIAARFGVTPARVDQIRHMALAKLEDLIGTP